MRLQTGETPKTILFLAVAVLLFSGIARAQETVTIDMSVNNGPATKRASGFLHGFNSTTPGPSIVNPTGVQMLRSAGDYLNDSGTYARVVGLGATPEFILSDAWNSTHGCYNDAGTCPGDGLSWAAWDSFVTTTVQNYVNAGETFQYDVWNEPDTGPMYFWPRSESQYQTMWQHAVNDIRAINSGIIIVGPTTCCQSGGGGWGTWATDLLSFAAANDVLPNILSLHENSSVSVLQADLVAAKAYLAANNPSITKIEINEYTGMSDDYLPGATAQYIATLERQQVWRAAHTCWNNDCNYETVLSGLVSPPSGSPTRAIWYAYQAYANITGDIVSVTPSATVDGVAGENCSSTHQADSLFGRSGATTTVTFNFINISANCSALIVGGQVHANVYALANDNGSGSSGPTLISSGNLTVSGNAISVTDAMGTSDAAIIELSAPAGCPTGTVCIDQVSTPASVVVNPIWTGPIALTFPVTVDSKANLLTVNAASGFLADGNITTTATFDGIGMSQVALVHADNMTSGYDQMFEMLNPPAGTFNVVVTVSGTDGADQQLTITAGAMSFINGSALSDVTTDYGSGTSASLSISGGPTDGMYVEGMAAGSPLSADTQTNAWLDDINGSTAAGNAAVSTAAGTSSTVTFGYTITGSDWWGGIAAYIAPPSSSPAAILSPGIVNHIRSRREK